MNTWFQLGRLYNMYDALHRNIIFSKASEKQERLNNRQTLGGHSNRAKQSFRSDLKAGN